MKIGIDMLPLKTYSFCRGIGKYTHNLIMKLLEIDEKNIYYLYNVPHELSETFAKYNSFVSYKKPIVSELNQLDIFLTTSIIELEYRMNFTFSDLKCKTALIFYDLIPVIFWNNYLAGASDDFLKFYFKKLAYVNQYDIIFSISKTTKDDLINLLEIPDDKIKTIYGGVDESFLVEKSDKEKISKLKSKYGIHEKFLLSTPGTDFRKNINGMFEAFSLLPSSIQNELSFVIVCKMQPEEMTHLKKVWSDLGLPPKKLILTNYIPVSDLVTLYDYASAFVFPSLYEGFGLPVLESMSRGCPVITSNISSLPEVCECAAFYVNPRSPVEIATAIETILENENLKNKMIELGYHQSKKFRWDKVAMKLKEQLENLCDEKIEVSNQVRRKVALFSPLNPIKSGISDYTENLLPNLAKFVDVDVFIDEGYQPTNEIIIKSVCIYSHKLFEKMYDKYDICVYQMGNSDYHKYMFNYIHKYPGIVVLHDLTLHGLFAHCFCKEGNKFNREKYLNYVFNNHGCKKYFDLMSSLECGIAINPFDISINFHKQIVDDSKLVLVHNDFSKSWIENNISFVNTKKINMGVPLPNCSSAEERNLNIGLGLPNGVVISAFGRITNTKRVDVLLKAFSKLVNERSVFNVKLVLVGELHNDVKEMVAKLITDGNLDNRVIITGHVESAIFDTYYQVTDICVNLRYPTSGETSATLVQALSYGIPCITTNYAQYKEYPDDCCWKVDLGDYEVDLLTDYLFELVTNEKLREKMSHNVREYGRRNFSIEQMNQEYLEAIEYAIKH